MLDQIEDYLEKITYKRYIKYLNIPDSKESYSLFYKDLIILMKSLGFINKNYNPKNLNDIRKNSKIAKELVRKVLNELYNSMFDKEI